jgi:hypothetical protein
MQIIAFIQEGEPIRKILKHLRLWDYPRRAPPKKIPLPIQQRLWPRYSTQDKSGSPFLQAAESWKPYAVDPETDQDAYCKDPDYQEA